MKYTQTSPCGNCPFLKEGGIRLHPERAREIADNMLSTEGATFACHKTAIDSDDENGRTEGPDSLHCAGALIFAEKNGNATQMMRICERLGMYDASKLKNQHLVFDDLDQMLDAQLDVPPKKRRRKGGVAKK